MYSEIIKKYYNFSSFYFAEEKNVFIVGANHYYIYYFDSLKKAIDCINLSFSSPFSFRPIYNKFHRYVTGHDSLFFVLFLVKKYEFNISDLFHPILVLNNIHLDWQKNWLKKSDYIVSFYASIKGQYSLIDESINYYLGLLDFCVYLLNDYRGYNDYGFIQHTRFVLDDYFNPTSFKIDIKERDFANYLKYLFFSGSYNDVDISKMIFLGKDIFNFDLLFIRLLFPDYYFDVFDDILLKKKKISALCAIISRQDAYLKYIKKIRDEIEKVYPIKKDINLIS